MLIKIVHYTNGLDKRLEPFWNRLLFCFYLSLNFSFFSANSTANNTSNFSVFSVRIQKHSYVNYPLRSSVIFSLCGKTTTFLCYTQTYFTHLQIWNRLFFFHHELLWFLLLIYIISSIKLCFYFPPLPLFIQFHLLLPKLAHFLHLYGLMWLICVKLPIYLARRIVLLYWKMYYGNNKLFTRTTKKRVMYILEP